MPGATLPSLCPCIQPVAQLGSSPSPLLAIGCRLPTAHRTPAIAHSAPWRQHTRQACRPNPPPPPQLGRNIVTTLSRPSNLPFQPFSHISLTPHAHQFGAHLVAHVSRRFFSDRKRNSQRMLTRTPCAARARPERGLCFSALRRRVLGRGDWVSK